MATTTDVSTLEARTRVVIESLPVDLAEVDGPAVRRVRVARPVPMACRGSAAPSVRGGRLTRRGRLVMSAAWVALVIVGVLGVGRPWAGAAGPGETSDQAPGRSVPGGTWWDWAGRAGAGAAGPGEISDQGRVRTVPGDTLWDVAGRVAPEADRREVVTAIGELNDLSSAGDIRPGDRLLLPSER